MLSSPSTSRADATELSPIGPGAARFHAVKSRRAEGFLEHVQIDQVHAVETTLFAYLAYVLISVAHGSPAHAAQRPGVPHRRLRRLRGLADSVNHLLVVGFYLVNSATCRSC
jgi:hypothetical protein